ncbi:MAG TPA: nucleotide exchange factor GrpE [Bacteroidota bacterium]|nr:nucleotide exchange factor GrpE [Bacteroidota bacterium]
MPEENNDIKKEQTVDGAPETAQPADKKPESAVLNEKIADLERQAAQLKDQLLRKAAEFDNYKRRTENDFSSLTRFAAENIITQLVPVLDDLNRSLKSGKEKSGNDPFYKGVELIYAKFLKVLEAQGLKAMDVVGQEFNVDVHDALMQMPRTDVPPHTVLEEVEKGYLLFDKVIRHAKVIVSSAPAEAPVQQTKTENFED